METQGGTKRSVVLDRLARGLAQRASGGRILRVAIDGPDGSGKTTFTRQLGDVLHPMLIDHAEVRRFSGDDHMIPMQVRRSDAAADPRWLYENFLDVARIREIARGEPAQSPPGTVVLIEGMTLQRPELADLWDVTVYITVPAALAIERARARYATFIDSTNEQEELEGLEERYRERYVPAFRLYADMVQPRGRADVVIEMHDFEAPLVLRWGDF
ncbi:hypothetical protein [Georgenia thermotolerans]|uniref:Uridine kinase n=1 Tax=Georgenia thermotolerans TaxID=527326 RepID=A0A7J5UQP0_9MICO|nr:hypothetical protein [Georgenia thermotolerans]KAE8764735.1 hypothetical protein GB883_07560 [Georgenia thermotolerans]